MKYNLRYSPSASQDLDDIYNYIKDELCSPIAAKGIINQILDKIETLQNYPASGRALSLFTDTDSGYRFLLSGNYIIFYRHSESNVYIDRILNARRDYIRILLADAFVGNESDRNKSENN